MHIDQIYFSFFFPFWPQFPYVLFMWSIVLPQDVLAVMELYHFCKNESLSNRNLNYDRWNWDIRIVLNLSLAKAWSVLGLVSREILHSLLHCCYKTSLIFTFPIKRMKSNESTQNINNSWLSTLVIVIYPLPPPVDNCTEDRQSFSILPYFKWGEISFCYWAKWNSLNLTFLKVIPTVNVLPDSE